MSKVKRRQKEKKEYYLNHPTDVAWVFSISMKCLAEICQTSHSKKDNMQTKIRIGFSLFPKFLPALLPRLGFPSQVLF